MPAAHCALTEDGGDRLVRRSLKRSHDHTDQIVHRHSPHQWTGGRKGIHQRPRQEEGGRKGLRHTSRLPHLAYQNRSAKDDGFQPQRCFTTRPHKVVACTVVHQGDHRNPVPLRISTAQLLPGGWKLAHQVHTPLVPTKVRDGQWNSPSTPFCAAAKSHQRP